jgi:hypothetical protein
MWRNRIIANGPTEERTRDRMLLGNAVGSPSIDLVFTSGVLDPRIDFQRTTTGTYYRGPFNQNLVTRSQDLDLWSTLDAVVTANAATAPDGTMTAERIVPNAVSAPHGVYRSTSVVGLAAYTQSVYVKADGLTWFYMTEANSLTASAWFDVANGIVGTVSGTGSPSASIENVGNGWFRCVMRFTTLSAQTLANIQVRPTSGNGVFSFAGDGINGLLAWGAQATEGSSLTPYLPTTTAAITQGQIAAAGSNVPRFENDPITGEARGLLIEGGATNLQLYSADITNGSARTNITFGATKITAPDGTTSGELVSATTTGATSLRGSTHTIAGTNATGSIFIKQGSLAVVQFWIIDSTTSTTILSGTYTFATKATTVVSGTGTMTATDVGNGWVRIALSVTTFVSGNNLRFFYGFNGGTATAGDSFYLWGVQIEQQSFASSYIPTTTATVARGADNTLMTGTNFSSWFNQAEGTIYAETLVTSTSGGGQLAASVYQNSNTYLDIGQGTATSSPSTTLFYIRTGGVDQAVLVRTLSPFTLYASARMAGAYRTNDAAYTLNGLSVVTDATVTLPSAPIELRVGQQQAVTTSSRLIRRIAYWPTRLPDATLQALTT